jgi:hypothetical protein
MPNPACDYRSSPFFMGSGSVFRFAFLSGAPELLGAVTKRFTETGRSKSPGGLGVLSLGLTTVAAKAQKVINFPSGFTGATGYITPENPVGGGSIHLIPGQGRRRF